MVIYLNDFDIKKFIVRLKQGFLFFCFFFIGNSWCCFYEDMEICYNRHTGYGGYGNWTRGSRIIGLDIENVGNQINYVRLENGTITDEFPKV